MNTSVSMHNNQESWRIDNEEKCTFLPKHENSVKQPYKVNIWKTMPLIPKALPVEWPVNLSDSVFINDSECKPSVAKTIYEQNYRSLYRMDNRAFDHRWLDHGMTLQLAPWNGDYDEMKISTKIDPSYCNNCGIEHPTYNAFINGHAVSFKQLEDTVR